MRLNANMNLHIVETDKQIKTLILKSIATEIDQDLSRSIKSIDSKIRLYTPLIFVKSLTYKALITGDLNAQIGFFKGQANNSLNEILDTIANSVKVTKKTVRFSGNKFTGGIVIEVLLSDYSDILSLSRASITTEKKYVLPWLDWILTKGDLSIVLDYEFIPYNGRGRSGGGLMSFDPGSSWRMPPAHSGTDNNNWLTRALRDYEAEIANNYAIIIKREISKLFR
jgi:hypothetical protein